MKRAGMKRTGMKRTDQKIRKTNQKRDVNKRTGHDAHANKETKAEMTQRRTSKSGRELRTEE